MANRAHVSPYVAIARTAPWAGIAAFVTPGTSEAVVLSRPMPEATQSLAMTGRLLLVALLLFALRPAAGADATPAPIPGPNQGLVGHWILVNQASALQIAFFDDGRYHAKTSTSVLRGKWALVDEEHVATWTDDSRPRRVNRFRIHGNNLVIIDPDGTHHVHRRQH